MSTTNLPAGSPTIAIVGSGPAGCYAAQFLRKAYRGAEIVIFDRLAEPYGLARYGVAPDHLGTKAVTKQFDRLFERDGVAFVGNAEIGTDITLATLRSHCDIVVLATGLSADRPLDCAGTHLAGIFGSGAITRLINGHPEETADRLHLGETVTIVGHGNVALDLVRLFLTPAVSLRTLGVSDAVVAACASIRVVEVVGRSAAPSAKFDVALAKELGTLADVRFEADGLLPDSADARVTAITDLIAASPAEATRKVHFRFGWTPVLVAGSARAERITFAAGTKTLTLDTDSICTAIGFSERVDAPLRRSDHETADTDLERGVLDAGLFCVGWLRRGPQGTIPANRVDSRLVVDEIIAAITSGRVTLGKPGYSRSGLPALLQETT